MTIYNALYRKSKIDIFQIPRKEGGRELHSVEETVNLTNLGLENYTKQSREHLLNAARSLVIDLIDPMRETFVAAKKKRKEERTISWKEKTLHDQFLRQTKEVGSQDV